MYAATGSQIRHIWLRTTISDLVLEHLDDFGWLQRYIDGGETVEAYFQRMRQPAKGGWDRRQWGDDLETLLAARVIDRPIVCGYRVDDTTVAKLFLPTDRVIYYKLKKVMSENAQKIKIFDF
jgi:hypothetical protein